MKYRPAGQIHKREFSPRNLAQAGGVLAMFVLASLPFVFSVAGLDKFRAPKSALLAVAAAGLLLVVAVAGKPPLPRRLLSWEGLFLLGWAVMVLHTVVLSNRAASWMAVWHFSVLLVLFLALKPLATLEMQVRTWLLLGVATGISALLTVLQFKGLFPVMQSPTGAAGFGRMNPAGLIGDVNSGGFLFGLTGLVLLYHVVHSKWKVAAAVLLALNLLGMAFTWTLSAIGAFAICFVFWVVFHFWWLLRQGRRARKGLYRFAGFLLVGLCLAVTAGWISGAGDRLETVLNQASQNDWRSATSGRTPVYSLTWQMVKNRPWLGYGLDTFTVEFFRFKTTTELGQSLQLVNQPGSFRQAHSEYLQIWQELGVGGLSLMLLLQWLPVILAVRQLRSLKDERKAYLLAVLSLAALFAGLNALAFFPLRLAVTGAFITFVYAGLRHLETDESGVRDSVAVARRLTFSQALRDARLWAVLALSLVAGYLAVGSWKANEEAGIAAFLIESANQPQVDPRQSHIFADEALDRLLEAGRAPLHAPEVSNLRGSALLLLGRYTDAADAYRRASEVIPSPEILTNLAAAYLALEDREKARENLELALKYNPDYRQAQEAWKLVQGGD